MLRNVQWLCATVRLWAENNSLACHSRNPFFILSTNRVIFPSGSDYANRSIHGATLLHFPIRLRALRARAPEIPADSCCKTFNCYHYFIIHFKDCIIIMVASWWKCAQMQYRCQSHRANGSGHALRLWCAANNKRQSSNSNDIAWHAEQRSVCQPSLARPREWITRG